jgi:hypothetical protein
MKIFYLLPVLLASVSLSAQDIVVDKIRWQCESISNLKTGSVTVDSGTVITERNERIVWESRSAPFRRYQIVESIGQWVDLTGPGSITYVVTDGFGTTTIRIYKADSKVKIKITTAGDYQVIP